MPLSTVSGMLTRMGWAGSAGSGSSQPSATSAPGRASSCTSTSRSSAGSRAAPASASAAAHAALQPPPSPIPAGMRRRTVGSSSSISPIDDYSRLAYAEVLPDEKAATAAGFLRRALAFFRRHGIQVERVLTDNGSAYRSAVHAIACRASASATSAPAPTGHRQTAKPSASSARCSTAGPTAPIYRSSHERTARP